MSSIHGKIKLAYVTPDGAGGFVLRVAPRQGELLDFELSARSAARLMRELALVVEQGLAQPPALPPDGEARLG